MEIEQCLSKLGREQCSLKSGHTCRHRWRGFTWTDVLVKEARKNDPLFQIKKLATTALEAEEILPNSGQCQKTLEAIVDVIWNFEYSTHLDPS